MTEVEIKANDAGMRLDRFLAKYRPGLFTAGVIRAGLRKNKIKVNGKKIPPETHLHAGDTVRLYYAELPDGGNAVAGGNGSGADVVCDLSQFYVAYEDDNIIVIDKPCGVLSQPSDGGNSRSANLADMLKRYLRQKGEYVPENENTFVPALCNRIDLNTTGLVIAAKNAAALRLINEKLRGGDLNTSHRREIKKYYLAAVSGVVTPPQATLTAYLYRNAAENKVYIQKKKTPRNKTVITKYRLLKTSKDGSLLEVELITGRTHQIRAHLASIGHPVIGDGRYGGDRAVYKKQRLCSYRLVFDFVDDKGGGSKNILDYLNGKVIESRFGNEILNDFV